MKIRKGFVSNSSSTSFIFIFRGERIQSLYTQIIKYREYFSLYGNWGAETEDEIRHCDAFNVMNSIAQLHSPRIITIDVAIEDINNEIKLIGEARNKHDNDATKDWFVDSIWELENKKIELEKAKKYGFTTITTIDFGDNHGDVCGGTVGYLMDYEGRNIYINKPDFMVWTKQNR